MDPSFAATIAAVVGVAIGMLLERGRRGDLERRLAHAEIRESNALVMVEQERNRHHRETSMLLNRIQAPEAAVGQAFADLDSAAAGGEQGVYLVLPEGPVPADEAREDDAMRARAQQAREIDERLARLEG
jgi:hypothetical protein